MVYANDISPASHKLMKDNFVLNDLDEAKYKMTLEDANLLLLNEKKNVMFDIVDLDPYGSVVPFLESSVEAIKDGGLMCVTCTDTKVTCGPDISKCYYYYGTTRAKVHHFNEVPPFEYLECSKNCLKYDQFSSIQALQIYITTYLFPD